MKEDILDFKNKNEKRLDEARRRFEQNEKEERQRIKHKVEKDTADRR